jgi:hypothetical protein
MRPTEAGPRPAFLLRLALDLIAAGLLSVGLAYYWLGNAVHELIGTAFFALLIAHNIFNRRWYGALPRTRRRVRGLVNIGATALLLTAMLALLVTSLMISNTVFRFLGLDGGFTARQIHIFAAYWALVLVAVHLGLRWPVIMSVARGLFGITGTSAIRTFVLRLMAAALAVQGVRSSFELGLGARLSMQITMDWWDFEASVASFFLHCAATIALYAALTYYAAKWIQRRRREAASAGAVVSQAER